MGRLGDYVVQVLDGTIDCVQSYLKENMVKEFEPVSLIKLGPRD